MKIHCHTNLDLHFNEQWPDELPCRPMKDDIITSSTGLELRVVRVLFGYKGGCLVELHLVPNRFENITKFEEWYKNRK